MSMGLILPGISFLTSNHDVQRSISRGSFDCIVGQGPQLRLG